MKHLPRIRTLALAALAAGTLAWTLGRRLLHEPPGGRRDVRVGLAVGVGALSWAKAAGARARATAAESRWR